MILSDVRFAYVYLDRPKPPMEGSQSGPKYALTAIIPKNHPQVQVIRDAAKAAATKKFGDTLPRGMRHPLRDGDEKDESGNRVRGPEFEGCFFLNATSTDPVEVTIGKDHRKPRTGEAVSGHYGDVQINAYAYDKAGNRGVAFGLGPVWFTRRGEPLARQAEPWAKKDNVDDWDSGPAPASNGSAKAAPSGPQGDDAF